VKRKRASARRRSKVKKPQGKKPFKPRLYSPEWISAKLAEQRKDRYLEQQEKNAKAAVKAYKVKKSDKGKIVMVGVKGQNNPASQGRKGYAIHVNNKGKKTLLKSGDKKAPYAPSKITDLEPANYPKLRKQIKAFTQSKRSLTHGGAIVTKGSGSVGNGPWDFSDKMVDKMSRGIQEVISRQAGQRKFILTAIVLVELPDGNLHSFEVNVAIDRPDHVAIQLAGIEAFVRQKFYAFMARELAYEGYVTSGSENHIRRLEVNKGKERRYWKDKRGEHWYGTDNEVARIKRIDWQLEQAK